MFKLLILHLTIHAPNTTCSQLTEARWNGDAVVLLKWAVEHNVVTDL